MDFTEFMKGFESQEFRIGILVITLYIIETILLVKTNVFDLRYSRIEDAKRRNHVITAKCVKGGYYSSGEHGSHDRTPHGTYEYSVDGKQYEFKHVFTSMNSSTPPAYITLYYLEDPGKAFLTDKRNTFKRILFHLIPWGISMLVYFFLYR